VIGGWRSKIFLILSQIDLPIGRQTVAGIDRIY
jgi:hypothetical protein